MSTYEPYDPPEGGTWPPPPTVGTRRKPKNLLWPALLIALVVLALAASCTALVVDATRQPDATNAGVMTQGVLPAAPAPVATGPWLPGFYPSPLTPHGVRLSTRVIRKSCYGSAGCNVTYNVTAEWGKRLDPNKSYELVYSIKGAEDGTQINTITLDGAKSEASEEEFAVILTKSTPLIPTVLSVEEIG